MGFRANASVVSPSGHGHATSDIRTVAFTPSRERDSPVLPELLDQIPEDEEIGTVTADGACDTRRCHTAIIAREATVIFPIRKNGRPWKKDSLAGRSVGQGIMHAAGSKL